MRVRIRGPSGSALTSFEPSDTVSDLVRSITETTALPRFEVRYGFPPKVFDLAIEDPSKRLSELSIDLNGEQLIIGALEDKVAKEEKPASSIKEASASSAERAPLSLSRTRNKAVESDPPQVPVPHRGATMVLRIMPDDNSCLFRAVGAAVMSSVDSMIELRALVAQTIQAQPDIYSTVVLEQTPEEYCKWIQTEESWGGFIELNILSAHFDVEICSIDVQTLRVDRFNEGRPSRCMLVYSGIHYDTIALSPSDPPHRLADAPPDFDTRLFDRDDDVVLQQAVELCRILQKHHYYTDTARFTIRCNICGGEFVGEMGATKHARETGHYDFGEAH